MARKIVMMVQMNFIASEKPPVTYIHSIVQIYNRNFN